MTHKFSKDDLKGYAQLHHIPWHQNFPVLWQGFQNRFMIPCRSRFVPRHLFTLMIASVMCDGRAVRHSSPAFPPSPGRVVIPASSCLVSRVVREATSALPIGGSSESISSRGMLPAPFVITLDRCLIIIAPTCHETSIWPTTRR